jgi:hypothetical protein
LTLIGLCSSFVPIGPGAFAVLAYETESHIGRATQAFRDPPAPAWIEPPIRSFGRDCEAAALAALADTPLASRFCAWPGISGRRYVFSVYPSTECPAFCDAVLLVVVRDEVGRRRVVSIVETGRFPEPVLLRAARDFRAHAAKLEFHMHLLAASAADRAAALADLAFHDDSEATPWRR